MRLIDADEVIAEIKRNKLLAREPGKWIPVSERLPENDTYTLVTTSRSYRIEMAWYFDGNFYWNNSDTHMSGVKAWMPLPEPYKPN